MKKGITSLFSILGITKDQGAIYLAALEIGEGTIQDLSRASGVKRTSIYNFINELKEKGLLSSATRGKRKIYEATSPRQLLEIGKSRLVDIEEIIPELSALYTTKYDKPKVLYFEGVDDIKKAYADMLSTRLPIVSYEDIDYLKKMLPEKYYAYLPPERARLGIPLKAISKDSPAARKFSENDRVLQRQTKFIKTNSPLKTEINIYGKKVLMISFREDRPFATIIEDKDIAETLRIGWELLWNRL